MRHDEFKKAHSFSYNIFRTGLYTIIQTMPYTLAPVPSNKTDPVPLLIKELEKRCSIIEQTLSGQKLVSSNELLHAAFDKKLSSSEKMLKEDFKKDLLRERSLIETTLTQTIERSFLKVIQESVADVKAHVNNEIENIKLDLEGKLQEVLAALAAIQNEDDVVDDESTGAQEPLL
jgi:hypothetical protein